MKVKKSNNKDTKQTNEQINSEGFILLFFLLAVFILIRVVFLNHPFESTWDIIALFLIGSIYFTIRHTMLGSFSNEYEEFKNSKKSRVKTFATGAMAGVLFIIFNIIQDGIPQSMGDWIEIIIHLIAFIAVFLGLDFIIKKISHQKAREKKDDDQV